MRAPYPSRSASALFYVSVVVFVAGMLILLVASSKPGELIAMIGVLGALASSYLNHKQNGGQKPVNRR